MIFKEITDKEKIQRRQVDELTPIFNDDAELKKTSSGWNYEKNSAFSEEPNVTASVYFVESSSFYVAYGSGSPDTDYEQYLTWNSLMSSVSAPWDRENKEYNFYLNDTKITEAVIVSFNPDNYKDTLDEDNFFLVMSGSTSDTAFTDKSGDTYSVSENLVLAPYYIKGSVNDTNTNGESSSKISPSYELRTSDSDNFLTYDETIDSISIDWDEGTISDPMGVVYPEVGLIVLFPELFNRPQVEDAIRTSGDKSLNALNSIMTVAGYARDRKEKTIVFSRLYNNEFNFTTNPSAFVGDGDNVRIRTELEKDNAKTYITQIGFYNRANECVAVGHLSKPVEKSYISENNFKVEIEV